MTRLGLSLWVACCCLWQCSSLETRAHDTRRLRHRRHDERRALQQNDTITTVDTMPMTEGPSCDIPQVQEKPVPATFTSSYPGSGAKITWRLIRAITGIYTGDDHDHNGRVSAGVAVAVKTHFPSHTPSEIFHADYLSRIQRAILLIRNPLSALPSYHNFVYEQTNGLMNHSTRAPIAAWIAWRNELFKQEVDKWVNHARWWIQSFRSVELSENKLHLLPYEYLVSPVTGPGTLERLGRFLGSVHSSIEESLIPPSQYLCVWEVMVQGGHVPGEKERRESHRSGGPSGDYPYTNVQLEYMIQSLIRLRDEFEPFLELYQLLQEYLEVIVERKNHVESLMDQE